MQRFANSCVITGVAVSLGVDAKVPEEGVKADRLPADDADVHLRHLLAPQNLETPWFLTIVQSVKEAIHPAKLPPLEVTSKPVPIKEIKIYAGNEAKAGISSLLIHVGVIALLVFIGSLKPVQTAIKQVIPLIAPDIRPYISQPKKNQSGGGGGQKNLLEANKGKLPKPAPKQFTPPVLHPIEHPQLPTPASIIAPDDIPNIQANNFGDPLGRLGIPSLGNGIGTGIGNGRGAGLGPGSGGGFGGGAYRIGGGVSAPSVLLKVEPEYSEEARKAKWQGTVVLSLVVDDQGRPQNLKVVRALGLGLDQKAIEAVEKWKFKPGMKDGKPVPVMATIEVNFRLL